MVINTSSELKFVKAFKRSNAIFIDILVVLLIRIIVAQILGFLWINKVLLNLLADFQVNFGTETIKNTPEHLEFLKNHPAFGSMLLFYFIIFLVGAIYHAYFNSSQWQATLGKRIMKIIIIDENGKKISFLKAISHYFLSLLPIIYIFYMIIFQTTHQTSLFNSMIANTANILFSIIAALWLQAHIFTKKRTTIYDLICKLIFIEGKTSAKYPWKNV